MEEPVRAVQHLGLEPGLDQVANDARAVEEETGDHDRIRTVGRHRRDFGIEGDGGGIVCEGLGLGADLFEQCGHEAADRGSAFVATSDERHPRGALAGDDVDDDRSDRLGGRHRAEEVGGVLLRAEGWGLGRG